MLFFLICDRWVFDPNGLYNLQFVRTDEHGLYLDILGRRVRGALVTPD